MKAKTIMELINGIISGEIPKEDAEQTFSVLFNFGRWRDEEELALFNLPDAQKVLKEYLECGNYLKSIEAEKCLLSMPNAKELFDICIKKGYVFNPKTVLTFIEEDDKREYLEAVIEQGMFMGYRGEDYACAEGFEKIIQRPDAAKLFIQVIRYEKRKCGLDILRDLLRKTWIDELPEEEHIAILREALNKKMYLRLRLKSQELLMHKLPEYIESYIECGGRFDSPYDVEFFNGKYDELCKKYIVEHRAWLSRDARKAILARDDAQYWVNLYAERNYHSSDASNFCFQYYWYCITRVFRKKRR